MKVVVAAFNQEKALVGAFSVIVQLHRLIVYSTRHISGEHDTDHSMNQKPEPPLQAAVHCALSPDTRLERTEELSQLSNHPYNLLKHSFYIFLLNFENREL